MIDFFQITTNHNVIGKTTNKKAMHTIDTPLKQDTNRLNPTILIYSDLSLEIMNYCYIDEFNRYYFIDRIEQVRKNLYRIHCKVDVLESYKLEILNAKDVDFINSVEVIQSTVNATGTPVREVSYVLSTIGG